MNSAPSQSLVNLLLESGVPSNEEAAQLAINLNGGSWVGQVLDSGKVDEQRFLGAIGNFFRVPIVSVDAKKSIAPLCRSCRVVSYFNITFCRSRLKKSRWCWRLTIFSTPSVVSLPGSC